MDRVIRWGILGTGNIARQFATGLKLCAGAALTAVGSRAAETARRFAGELNIPHAHGSYAALAADATVDAVYIATPHSLHRDNMVLCLEAGKAVLCEKPLTVNARQARQVIELARQRNLFLMEAMWTRFLPPIVELRKLLAERTVGEIRKVVADLGFRLPWDPVGRVFNLNLAGGCLLDVGIYPISLAIMILGAPDSVNGEAVIGATGVDETDSILLNYQDGRSAELSASIRDQTAEQASLFGTDGRIDLVSHWWKGGPIVVRRGEQTSRLDIPIVGNGYQYEADEVCRCLRTGKTQSNVMPLNDSLIIMEILDQLRARWELEYPME